MDYIQDNLTADGLRPKWCGAALHRGTGAMLDRKSHVFGLISPTAPLPLVTYGPQGTKAQRDETNNKETRKNHLKKTTKKPARLNWDIVLSIQMG